MRTLTRQVVNVVAASQPEDSARDKTKLMSYYKSSFWITPLPYMRPKQEDYLECIRVTKYLITRCSCITGNISQPTLVALQCPLWAAPAAVPDDIALSHTDCRCWLAYVAAHRNHPLPAQPRVSSAHQPSSAFCAPFGRLLPLIAIEHGELGGRCAAVVHRCY